MKTADPYAFIHIGLLIRLLRHCEGYSVAGVIQQGRKLITKLRAVDFGVSVAGAVQGDRSLDLLLTDLEKETDKGRKVNVAELQRFDAVFNILENIVFAEANTKRLYLLSDNRFNIDALLTKPAMMFSSGVLARLPLIARQDISSGFQCLAFDQPTATAFHLLRASEAVLKAYYFVMVRRKRLETPMWGNMLDALAKRRNPDNKLLDRLRYIKDSFRNPTNHPEATYSLHEAQDLIGICIDVINRMATTLPPAPTEAGK